MMSRANIANTTAMTSRTPVVGNANWIAYSVRTIPESIRLGASDESAAIAMRVVDTVNTSSTVARVSSGRVDPPPPAR